MDLIAAVGKVPVAGPVFKDASRGLAWVVYGDAAGGRTFSEIQGAAIAAETDVTVEEGTATFHGRLVAGAVVAAVVWAAFFADES